MPTWRPLACVTLFSGAFVRISGSLHTLAISRQNLQLPLQPDDDVCTHVHVKEEEEDENAPFSPSLAEEELLLFGSEEGLAKE